MRKTLSMLLAFALAFAIAPLNVIAEGENVDLGTPEETVLPAESEVPVEENADVQIENETSENVAPIKTLNETDDRVIDEASTMACDAENVVACVNDTTGYETLNKAVASVVDGTPTTIKLMKNIDNATGIAVPEGRNIVFDFNGKDYTLVGPGAGSTNTETNGFQLLKDSNLTFKNGKIRVADNANRVLRIFQSYANVTFEDFIVDAVNFKEDFPLSFNNGNITFKGNTTVKYNGQHAFDVCKFSNYPSVTVTFDANFTGEIQGTILYDSSNTDTHKLIIGGNGTFNKIATTNNNADKAISVKSGTFKDASVINYLTEGANVTVDLQANVTSSIVVPANTNVTLNLNGNKVSNTDGQHTITNNGTLVINGEGLVDNTSHAKGAVLNKGNLTITGGEFTRSKEAGFKPGSGGSGGNSWYVISNEQGATATFDGGNVHSTGKYSSLVRNYGTMNINGGEFSNGFIAIKNEEDSNLAVNGGNITGTQSVQTYGNAKITGGTLSGQVSVNNYEGFNSTATITGGQINGDVVVWDDAKATGKIDAVINGGEVNGKLVIWDDKKNPIDQNDKLNIDVESGKFSNDVSKYVVPDKASIDVDNKFYVGTKDQVQAAVNNAQDSVNVLVGVDSINVPEGIKVTNSSGKDIKVNDVTVKAGDAITVKAPVAQNDKPETKPAVGWDDGGPFTTNAEGDVFDRWGNLIYDAPSMGNTTNGYVFVNTSDK